MRLLTPLQAFKVVIADVYLVLASPSDPSQDVVSTGFEKKLKRVVKRKSSHSPTRGNFCVATTS